MMPIWKSIVYVSSKCKMYNMDSDEASIVQLAHNVVTDHMVLEYIVKVKVEKLCNFKLTQVSDTERLYISQSDTHACAMCWTIINGENCICVQLM